MDQDDMKVQATNSIEEIAIYGRALTEALYEILADKGILTGENFIDRIKKLKNEIKVNLSLPN